MIYNYVYNYATVGFWFNYFQWSGSHKGKMTQFFEYSGQSESTASLTHLH